jgi:hypothetical protein
VLYSAKSSERNRMCIHLALETALLRRRIGEVRNIVPLKI